MNSQSSVSTVGANVTFHQHIKPLFTQWDQVQMAHNVDVGHHFDLWSYAQVKNYAAPILQYLTKPAPDSTDELYSGMPKYIGPWSSGDIDLFKAWMSNGYLEGQPPTIPEIPEYPQLCTFISLSEKLTGFDDLPAVMKQLKAPSDPCLASIYLYRLFTGVPGADNSSRQQQVGAMLFEHSRISELPEAEFDALFDAVIVEPFQEYVQDILTLWYGAFINDRTNNTQDFGTPEFNQHKYGLVWLNAGAHPMGYAIYATNTEVNKPLTPHTNTNDNFYWANEPSNPNSDTGLFTENTGY